MINDVFISYSRRDKVFAQKLNQALAEKNRQVWVDWEYFIEELQAERNPFNDELLAEFRRINITNFQQE